ncbi:MAG: flagellar basal body L-ring protein FlgH [Desulfosalsimonadaceae bacterium]
MKHAAAIILIFSLAFALVGCAGHKKPGGSAGTDSQADSGAALEAQRAEQEARKQQTGSLWQQSRGSLFTANKASRVGDILTVAIYEQASAEKEAGTSTGRSSEASMGIPKLLGYEAALAAKNPNLDPSDLISAETENNFEGTGSTSREGRLTATLTTRVVEVSNNGNLRIEGSKTVRVNNEDQIIRLTGAVRPDDVEANNIVDSKYVLDARIEYTGEGVIAGNQRPGWLSRVLGVVWPF